ncbi:hypothetical protein HDV00_010193 [Rhizophlyctis rosea]|nr:hypothetical protein HDV00_010193 [Rhizophlyctis rosea]
MTNVKRNRNIPWDAMKVVKYNFVLQWKPISAPSGKYFERVSVVSGVKVYGNVWDVEVFEWDPESGVEATASATVSALDEEDLRVPISGPLVDIKLVH